MNLCWLVAVVNENAQFAEHKLSHYMGEIANVIGGVIYLMNFCGMNLVVFVFQGLKINADFLRRAVFSLVRDDQTVPVSEHDVIETMS